MALEQERWEQFKTDLRAYTEERARSIKDLEALCRQYWKGKGVPSEHDLVLERRSDAWYAAKILVALRFARGHLSHGEPEWAAIEALEAGILAGSWPPAQKLRERRAKKRKAGLARGEQIAAEAKTFRDSLPRLIDRYNTSDELQDLHRTLVAYLADWTGKHTRTIARHLKRLKL